VRSSDQIEVEIWILRCNTQGRPLLVEGAAGSGKTAMIEAAAAATGNHDRLVLHLDDQADSKSLLGQYVCGPAPGQFRWQVRANQHPPSSTPLQLVFFR
jgi:midasin (ATPase involved in ribosome maturation)